MTDFSTWFEGLYRTYYTALLAAAERKLSRRELAEEAVQETFLRLWARSERLEKHPNPGGWLMVTLSHVVGHTVRDEAHYVLALPERLRYCSGRGNFAGIIPQRNNDHSMSAQRI